MAKHMFVIKILFDNSGQLDNQIEKLIKKKVEQEKIICLTRLIKKILLEVQEELFDFDKIATDWNSFVLEVE